MQRKCALSGRGEQRPETAQRLGCRVALPQVVACVRGEPKVGIALAGGPGDFDAINAPGLSQAEVKPGAKRGHIAAAAESGCHPGLSGTGHGHSRAHAVPVRGGTLEAQREEVAGRWRLIRGRKQRARFQRPSAGRSGRRCRSRRRRCPCRQGSCRWHSSPGQTPCLSRRQDWIGRTPIDSGSCSRRREIHRQCRSRRIRLWAESRRRDRSARVTRCGSGGVFRRFSAPDHAAKTVDPD